MGVGKEAKRGERAGKRIGINKKKFAGYGGECNTVKMMTEMLLIWHTKTVCQFADVSTKCKFIHVLLSQISLVYHSRWWGLWLFSNYLTSLTN